ncbi:hypothetical protein PHMEG_00041652 [Phytophthora megakarya]|uniref:Uncharacterized protein n=1 Tax=Phytophthora megakarya TaxID=4795 RepID=A0A225UDV5_9STRA|nr:hypothetical protein PHMEG_00041652 [Phytophthora megakarya]
MSGPPSSYVQTPSEVIASRMHIPSSTQETVDLTAVDDAEVVEDPVTPNLVKLYVDDQVRRWERVSLEFVMSPTIELVRLAPNMSADLTSVTVPLIELSMRECAAVLQTMFFEFRNLIPEWFRMSATKAEVDVMRRQQLLTVVLLEWQQVTSGAQCRVVSPLHARNLQDHSEEMKPEDDEGDSLMSSYEAELLGRELESECIAVLRVHHLENLNRSANNMRLHGRRPFRQ